MTETPGEKVLREAVEEFVRAAKFRCEQVCGPSWRDRGMHHPTECFIEHAEDFEAKLTEADRIGREESDKPPQPPGEWDIAAKIEEILVRRKVRITTFLIMELAALISRREQGAEEAKALEVLRFAAQNCGECSGSSFCSCCAREILKAGAALKGTPTERVEPKCEHDRGESWHTFDGVRGASQTKAIIPTCPFCPKPPAPVADEEAVRKIIEEIYGEKFTGAEHEIKHRDRLLAFAASVRQGETERAENILRLKAEALRKSYEAYGFKGDLHRAQALEDAAAAIRKGGVE